MFTSKLIVLGDYLYKHGDYANAKLHCYDNYLNILSKNSKSDDFQDKYFRDGFKADTVPVVCQVMFGKGLCEYKMLIAVDPYVDRIKTVDKLVDIMREFQLLSQHLIPLERHYWIVYNCTIYIYNIAKLLLDRGYSKKSLEFLIWCCVSMENVVPLMTVKFLPWRGTLYTTVCYCYYDICQPHLAEKFARRGLQKVHQLAKIEEQSLSEATEDSEAAFRIVTVKLSIVIFKNVVFECRRPKKIVHRPKTRQNLKELQGLPFPRTPTEKQVLEMFDGRAAQLLGIIEALTVPGRRTCIPGPPPVDTMEGGDSLTEVWGELILGWFCISLKNLTMLMLSIYRFMRCFLFSWIRTNIKS